ncbi:hypothetical protein, partial [Shewanella sp.]|uniref:hypothetical protein n=1 Tax=Shewanella sp. TaxID=50422 RepID=UPI003A9861E6
ASFSASALNSCVWILRGFFVDILHLNKRVYSLSEMSKSIGSDQTVVERCLFGNSRFLAVMQRLAHKAERLTADG